MRVLISGGGTAGHIYPALSVAEELLAEGHDEVAFVGTPTGLEARLVREAGVRFFGLPAAGFDRARPSSAAVAGMVAAMSTVRATALLRRWRPDVVAGFGAYVTIPIGLAAALTRTPLVLHEQNSVPGLANRLLSRWARAVGVTYEESAALLKHPERARVTGNPVRRTVLGRERGAARAHLGLPHDATVVLVFGGSRGARHLNEAVLALRDELLSVDGVIVVHVSGRAEHDSVLADLERRGGDAGGRYRVLAYADDMGSCIAAADLVVARAGATSLAEVTAIGRAAVLVPYPFATDDHQTRNARALVDAGAAVVVRDEDLDGPALAEAVLGLLREPAARATMAAASRAMGRPDAAKEVADLIRSSARDRD